MSEMEADGVTCVLPATRDAALRRLDAFLPRAGRAYAENRNTEGGPDVERSVSALSPYCEGLLVAEGHRCSAYTWHSVAGQGRKVPHETLYAD